MAKVELKKPIIDEIKELLTDAQSAVLVSYRGITVEEDTALRKELREADVVYKVFKNTMLRFAVKDTDFESLTDDLNGPTALAVSKTDATAPARILSKYAKDIEVLDIKSAVVEGTFYDKDGIKVIASIPSRDELLAKFLGSIQSPITNFARVLNQIAEKGGADAAEETKAEEPAEAPAEEAKAEEPAEAPAEEAKAEEPAEAPAEEAKAEEPAEVPAEEAKAEEPAEAPAEEAEEKEEKPEE